jgi:di/tricarboxylate transporter
MSAGALLTLVAILVALALMISDKATPDVALLGALVSLAVLGVVTPTEALAGFANHGMLTVAGLFVIADGLDRTGAVERLASRVLGRPRTARQALARMVPPVILSSAVLNNTAVVAAMLPAVRDWSRRMGIAPSRVLMALSFGSILGGTCTLIGTSTNLVVAGLVQDALGEHAGLFVPGFFDITPLGVPVALCGGLVLVLLGPLLLPDRGGDLDGAASGRDLTAELVVAGPPIAGRTIEEAGLRHLPGMFVAEVIRGDHVIPAVAGDLLLETGDQLVFVGDIHRVAEIRRMPGLDAPKAERFDPRRGDRLLAQVVVSQRSPLVGRSLRESKFRAHYHAVVLAVSSAGERVRGRLGDHVFHAGDLLLVEAQREFLTEEHRRDFTVISRLDATPPRRHRSSSALAILLVVIVALALGASPPVVAFAGAGAMVLLRCLSVAEGRDALDLQVLVAIAAALGLGSAMRETGLDTWVVGLAVGAGIAHPWVALVLLYVMTAVVTEVVTNNAAAALAVPIGLALAEQLGVSPMPYVFTVTMAASASFLTPIGYQTNLMVYGPGGYRSVDFLRAGLPLALVSATVTCILVPFLWPF